MNVDFDFGELFTIKCALYTLAIVYGSSEPRDAVLEKVSNLLDSMDDMPIDELYPKACENVEGVGTINT